MLMLLSLLFAGEDLDKALPEMVRVSKGDYDLGSSGLTHSPNRTVEILNDFFIMNTEVTLLLWNQIMDVKKTTLQCPNKNCPVAKVSWFDAIDFANTLSTSLGFEKCYTWTEDSILWNEQCDGFRLPTEAEWEISALDNKMIYSGSNDIQEVSWFLLNANRNSHPVALKKPNLRGIYDMSGNVWEWVWEGKGKPQKSVSRTVQYRMRKGGSWSSGERASEVFLRSYFSTKIRNPSVGIRLVRMVPPKD
jgi:formylglycine-generating enzyme required for sulfatase activity